MRSYHIHLLTEEVAYDYFGKELLIFNLFLENRQTANECLIPILTNQINYITNPISIIEINRFIEKSLNIKPLYEQDKIQFTYKIRTKRSQSMAKLEVYDQYLLLSSEGSYEAETAFFETLRKYSPYFLAMDFEHGRFGWLNPIKQRQYV
ncbi:sporulation inhibitor of replication protein SirA [Bacillus sp. Marseille-P3661]|uniref:sporulation inhibitor of replication protein SirA n=1 Tax=Bacillus sp. Marseille-P3661 TaxID=1936234 RepID=UPI000C84E33B|nr:sporulation inhibitor of replication protein SirA [Bacillus sp. Marseille-P3661]